MFLQAKNQFALTTILSFDYPLLPFLPFSPSQEANFKETVFHYYRRLCSAQATLLTLKFRFLIIDFLSLSKCIPQASIEVVV